MREIPVIKDELDAVRAEYQDKANSLPPSELRSLTDKVKTLQAEMSARIANGAKACEVCENSAHGMEQQVAIKGHAATMYEVGCLTCPDRRAQGFTPEQAVGNWNDGKFIPPVAR